MPNLIFNGDQLQSKLKNDILSLYQKSGTSLLGGQQNQNRVRQLIQGLATKAQEYGLDSPVFRDLVNSFSNLTGIYITDGRSPKLTPNIQFATRINNKDYAFSFYEDEQEKTFVDSINWSEADIVGRSSPIFAYRNSVATSFTLTGFLKVDSPDEVNQYLNIMQTIQSIKYPVNFGLGVGSPPIWDLLIKVPYTNSDVYSAKVRINSVSWTFVQPYLESVNGGKGVPTITRLSFDIAVVEESTINAQVSYLNKIQNVTVPESFTDKAVSSDGENSSPNNTSFTDSVIDVITAGFNGGTFGG